MRKSLQIFMVIVLCFVLVGCGCSKKDKVEEDDNVVLDLYTEEGKLVYNNNDLYKMVFYYNSKNEITGYEHYYKYVDKKSAIEECEKARATLKNDSSIKEIKQTGQYVIYVFNSSEYSGKKLDDIKAKYDSYLVPVYER